MQEQQVTLPQDLNGVHIHFVGIKGTGMAGGTQHLEPTAVGLGERTQNRHRQMYRGVIHTPRHVHKRMQDAGDA